MVIEKEILTQFLKIYENSPCLWDQNNDYYSNREARDEACNQLLKKMKQLNENATVIEVRKKIEYMRTAYRRENKKVLEALLAGDEHKPTLWYYDLLSFLDPQLKSSAALRAEYQKRQQQLKNSAEESEEVEELNSEDFSKYDEEPMEKKRKVQMKQVNEVKREDSSSDDDIDTNIAASTSNVKKEEPITSSISEAEAFGRTIGLQLNELDNTQKTIAEKLISDTIYCGRLNKLTVEACVNVSENE